MAIRRQHADEDSRAARQSDRPARGVPDRFEPLLTLRQSHRLAKEFSLTPREQEILLALTEGLLEARIVQRFNTALETIRKHRRAVLRKLGCKVGADRTSLQLSVSGVTGLSLSADGLYFVEQHATPTTATATVEQGDPQDVTGSATWSSDDPGIAVVDEVGVVTGVAAGATTIRAQFEGYEATLPINVLPFCEGDANVDRTVDPLDAGFVQARFGCPVGIGDPRCDSADANGDGFVDPLDVGYVLSRFGACQ